MNAGKWVKVVGFLTLGCETKEARTGVEESAAELASSGRSESAPAPTPSSGEGAPARTGELCARICARSAPLSCREGASCAGACAEMQALPMCGAEMTRFLKCLAEQPPRHWECDEQGAPAIKEGFCDGEQSAFATCMGGASEH